MKTLEEIKKIIAEHRTELQEKYMIKYMGIFGSYVRGEQDEKSDIDILVEFEENAIIGLKFFQMENHLAKILGTKVDLVTKNALKPRMGKHILKEMELL